MGLFALLSGIYLLLGLVTFPYRRHRQKGREAAVYICLFAAAWAATGLVCFYEAPSLFSLIFRG